MFVVYLGHIPLGDTSLPLSRYQNTWQTWFRPMNVDKSVSNQTYTPIINKQSMSNLQRLNLTWRNSIKPQLVLFFKVTSFKTSQKNPISNFDFSRQPVEFFFSQKICRMKAGQNKNYDIINKQSMSNLQRLSLTWRNSIKPLALFFKVTSFKTGQKNLFSSETKWNEASELNWTWTTTRTTDTWWLNS